MARRGNTNRRHNDENQFDSVEFGTSIVVCQKAKQKLANHGPKQGEDVDEQTWPTSAVGPVYKGYRRQDDIC